MKIEHEIPAVRIVRFRTIAEALIAGLGKHILGVPPNRILSMMHLKKPTEAEKDLNKILQAALWKEYEGAQTYERTLALVSLERKTDAHEIYHELVEKNYYPASISESMCYLPLLAIRNVEVEVVFHLGTFIRDGNFTEKRLLTRKSDGIELVPFYHSTKLKPQYAIVAVKKEKKRFQ